MDIASTPITLVTWNLQGSAGVDIEGVAEVIAASGADVVLVQEIQRRQARRVAAALGMTHMRWAFKNLSPYTWPEGLAIFTNHRLRSTAAFVLRRSWSLNWRRRIALAAEIERGNDRFGVINVHLSPHDDGASRDAEARIVVDRARRTDPCPVIAGDLNDAPGGPGYEVLARAGWSDAWTTDTLADLDGATNWSPGNRLGRPPDQRIDVVFVPPGWVVEDARVLAEVERFDWFAGRSDHVPLLATLRPPPRR